MPWPQAMKMAAAAKGFGEGQFRDGRAAAEGVVSDGGEGGGEGEHRERGASGKGAVADGGEAGRECELGEGGACVRWEMRPRRVSKQSSTAG